MMMVVSFVIRSLIFLAILVVLAMNISIAKTLPYADLVDKYATQYQVDPALVHAVIKQESNYDTLAVSHAGEGKVDRYHGIPPYKETQRYVVRVMANYQAIASIVPAPKPTKSKLEIRQPANKIVLKRPKKAVQKTIHISGSSNRIYSVSLTRINQDSTRISHSMGNRS